MLCLDNFLNFISFMDRLFDIFNLFDTPNSKIFNDPFKNNGHQLDHLNEIAKMFENMKVINKFKESVMSKSVNFNNSWLITISGLKIVWNSLNPNQNKKYTLCIDRINQDCLKNLFRIFHHNMVIIIILLLFSSFGPFILNITN